MSWRCLFPRRPASVQKVLLCSEILNQTPAAGKGGRDKVVSGARSSVGHLAPQATRDGRLLSLGSPTDPPLSQPHRSLGRLEPPRRPWTSGRWGSCQRSTPTLQQVPFRAGTSTGSFHRLTSPPFPPEGCHSGPHKTHHNARYRSWDRHSRVPGTVQNLPSRFCKTDLSKPRGKRSSGSAGSSARMGQEVPPSPDRQRPHATQRGGDARRPLKLLPWV